MTPQALVRSASDEVLRSCCTICKRSVKPTLLTIQAIKTRSERSVESSWPRKYFAALRMSQL